MALRPLKNPIINLPLASVGKTFSHFKYRKKKVTTKTVINAACYAHVNRTSRPLERLVVFHRPDFGETDFDSVSYVIKDSPLSKCFLTKSIEKGFKNGFEVDVTQPHNHNMCAIICLRAIWENENFLRNRKSWTEAGASMEEAWLYTFKFNVNGDFIGESIDTHWHGISSRIDPARFFKGEFDRTLSPSNQSTMLNWGSVRQSFRNSSVGLDNFSHLSQYRNPFGGGNRINNTKENREQIIQGLREIILNKNSMGVQAA